MRGEELVGFLHSDISGLNRGRSVALSELEKRLATGVGWVPADGALTPFGPIAEPNPWGALGDLRLLPDKDTGVRVDLWDEVSPLMGGLRGAGLEPEAFLAEYGAAQDEVPCAPAEGVVAAGQATAMREDTR